MRRLSNTFLVIGAVFSFVYAGIFLISAIVCFALCNPGFLGMIQEALKEHVSPEAADGIMIGMTAGFITAGVCFLFIGGLGIPSGIVALKAKKNPTTGLLVANIVLSALSCTEFNMAGGILGLIRNARERRNERRAAQQVVDAK